jgi:hypothetical protein
MHVRIIIGLAWFVALTRTIVGAVLPGDDLEQMRRDRNLIRKRKWRSVPENRAKEAQSQRRLWPNKKDKHNARRKLKYQEKGKAKIEVGEDKRAHRYADAKAKEIEVNPGDTDANAKRPGAYETQDQLEGLDFTPLMVASPSRMHTAVFYDFFAREKAQEG